MAKPKHRFKEEPPKRDFPPAVAIGFLIFCILIIIGTIIFILSMKGEQAAPTGAATEPMTMGVFLINDQGETVIPTSPPTIPPTEKPTVPSTELPTNRQSVETPTEAEIHIDADAENAVEPVPTEQPTNSVTGLLAAHHLIDIDNPDSSYVPAVIELSDYDREQAARVIMGEVGGEGYGSACLIAQCLRDTMVYEGYTSIDQVISEYQYNGYNGYPDEDCYVALDYVFGGGMAVEHRILYFYAPDQGYSPWHETQNFVTYFRGVRFFDSWY